jgi:hypothetical protein
LNLNQAGKVQAWSPKEGPPGLKMGGAEQGALGDLGAIRAFLF